MTPIIKYLEEGIVPSDSNEARALRAKIGQYTMESGVLFKKGYLIPMLRCVGPLQANYVIREIHMGSCGMHVGPRAVVRKAMRQGYYWPTMHADAKQRGKAVGQDNGQGDNPFRDGQHHMQIWSPKNHRHGQWGTTEIAFHPTENADDPREEFNEEEQALESDLLHMN
ncbi:hypothetical protein Tco_0400780 [Tanacetum coccineum]